MNESFTYELESQVEPCIMCGQATVFYDSATNFCFCQNCGSEWGADEC